MRRQGGEGDRRRAVGLGVVEGVQLGESLGSAQRHHNSEGAAAGRTHRHSRHRRRQEEVGARPAGGDGAHSSPGQAGRVHHGRPIRRGTSLRRHVRKDRSVHHREPHRPDVPERDRRAGDTRLVELPAPGPVYGYGPGGRTARGQRDGEGAGVEDLPVRYGLVPSRPAGERNGRGGPGRRGRGVAVELERRPVGRQGVPVLGPEQGGRPAREDQPVDEQQGLPGTVLLRRLLLLRREHRGGE
mmetsp:Transcript_45388/g.84050  ORF Transcript_45388/g.84050 Transcript_45388/m.84050 type:complete len:242 (+) Transcript_45388:1176-1901(+)